jgi:hypothetical protein
MAWTKSGGNIYYDLGDGTIGSSGSGGVNHDYADTSDKTVKIWSPDGWAGLTAIWMNGHDNCNNFPSIINLTNLTFIDASYNQFTGNIPSFSTCPSITEFRLNGNQFSGTVPSFNALTELAIFTINDNPSLSGTLPSFDACTALQYFNITNNTISGTLPSFNTCTALQYFYANQIAISGTLPSFAGCTALIQIQIDDTAITNTMPSFNTCTLLEDVHMNAARFTGTIPTFNACHNLIEVYIPMNVGTGFQGYTSGSFSTQKNMNELSFYGSSLPQASIDAILTDLVASLGGGRVTCIVELDGGSNAHPSATGMTNRTTLTTAGWTVNIN